MIDQLTCGDLLAVPIYRLEHGAVRVNVVAFAMLFSVFPIPLESFAIWVVEHAESRAIVVLELPLVDLSVGPEVFPEAVLFVIVPFSLIYPTIRPVEEPGPVHRIVLEKPLVNFHLAGDGSAVTVAKTVLEPALVDRVATFEDFESFSIWSAVRNQDVSAVFCPTLSLLELNLLLSGLYCFLEHLLPLVSVEKGWDLRWRIVVEIQRPKELVGLRDLLVLQLVLHVVVVADGKLIVQWRDIRHEGFLQLKDDVPLKCGHLLLVFRDTFQGVLRRVHAEIVHVIAQLLDSLLQRCLLIVEFNDGVILNQVQSFFHPVLIFFQLLVNLVLFS